MIRTIERINLLNIITEQEKEIRRLTNALKEICEHRNEELERSVHADFQSAYYEIIKIARKTLKPES